MEVSIISVPSNSLFDNVEVYDLLDINLSFSNGYKFYIGFDIRSLVSEANYPIYTKDLNTTLHAEIAVIDLTGLYQQFQCHILNRGNGDIRPPSYSVNTVHWLNVISPF